MADKRTTPETPQAAQQDASQGPRRSKRAAPTIDLTASEVPQAAASEAPADGTPDESASDGPAQRSTPEHSTARRSASVSALAIAAGSGAAVVLIALFVLWLKGIVPVGSANDSAQISALEKQVRDLQNRPSAAPRAETDEALRQRVAKLEQTIANLPGDAAIADKLAAADNAMKSLGTALAALNQRADNAATNAAEARKAADAATKAVADLQASMKAAAANAAAGVPRADFDAMERRVTTLENSAKAAHEEFAKNSGTDRAARLALSAAALRDAAQSGAPFEAELVQAKSLGADTKVLMPLESFAAGGVPSTQGLAQELRAMMPGLIKLWHAQAPQGGFLERLEANAGKLVRVTPIDAPRGDDPSAILARVEIDAARADIPAALADLDKLPDLKLTDQSYTPLQMWIVKSKQRQAGLDAARQFAADTARGLGQP